MLEGRTRARGSIASLVNAGAIDAWLDEDANSAVIELKTHAILPSLAVRSRHATVRSMEASLQLIAVERALSAEEHTSPQALFEARAERVAEDRLPEVFAVLERASSPPTAAFVREGVVVMEVYTPTSAAAWTAHTRLLDEIVTHLSPVPRSPSRL